MIYYLLLWLIPVVLLVLLSLGWLVLKILKEQKEIAAAIAQIDQSAAIRRMSSDLENVMSLIAQDVRLAGLYKEDRDDLIRQVEELKARTEKAEAAAEHERNRRIGAVNKIKKLKASEAPEPVEDIEEYPF